MRVEALSPRGAVAQARHLQRPAHAAMPAARSPADAVTLGDGASRSVADPGGPADAAGAPEQPLRLPGAGAATGLSEDELVLVDQLQARDREVRSHESAHQAAGGSLAGGASYSYQRGPDGRAYAVGGEVPIDLSGGRTPQETIRLARQIRAAALAPSDPSGQDLRVAAAAAAMEAAAQLQLGELERLARTGEGTPQQPKKLPDHLHGGEPCLACEKNAASYKA
jgi:hypothetical protein